VPFYGQQPVRSKRFVPFYGQQPKKTLRLFERRFKNASCRGAAEGSRQNNLVQCSMLRAVWPKVRSTCLASYRYAMDEGKKSNLIMEFAPISVYLVISLLLSLILVGVSFLFASSSNLAYPEKLSAYECGFDPFDDARSRFDIRFYLVSILFIIFGATVSYQVK
jgi:NADH-ubiquinone/plastoquinone oxidoreductase, chain 3